MKLPLLLLPALVAVAAQASAAIQSKPVTYQAGDVTCEGVLVYDDAVTDPRPGVLIIHQWMGITAHETSKAEELAKLGYVAFCADIYGKGVRPADMKQAGEFAGKYKGDRALYRERLNAALTAFKAQPQVNGAKLASTGYCFGGTGVLELAREGAPVLGVVSFHGGLGTPEPATSVKTKVLVLHGADDPFVPAEEVAAFKKEMADAKADYQFVAYSGAVHSFTQKAAGNDNAKGAAYNAEADEKSWAAMKEFLAAVLK